MAALQDVSSEDRRRFRTGRPCLDFAHTGGEGDWARWELVHDAGDVARWLGVVLDGAEIAARPSDLAPFRTLRHAITRAAFAAIAGEPPRAEDVAAINAAARAAPLVPQLALPGGARWAPGTAAQALSTLARDAVDLFAGPLAGRIRVCAGERCGLLFVDASRPGRRRWCSMERCGNLAKTRAYRAGRDTMSS